MRSCRNKRDRAHARLEEAILKAARSGVYDVTDIALAARVTRQTVYNIINKHKGETSG